MLRLVDSTPTTGRTIDDDDDDSDENVLTSARRAFSPLLLGEDACKGLIPGSASEFTSGSRAEASSTGSLAPPHYTPDPDTSAPVQNSIRTTTPAASNPSPTSEVPSPAESSSSALNRMSSASIEELDDTHGDLQVEGKLKVKKRGIIRGLKSVFKDSKGKKEKHVSFDGEGGVVGASGARGD